MIKTKLKTRKIYHPFNYVTTAIQDSVKVDGFRSMQWMVGIPPWQPIDTKTNDCSLTAARKD